MKYSDFYRYLAIKIDGKACIGPSVSIELGNGAKNGKIFASSNSIPNKHNNSHVKPRFTIFPVKIYGETINHLNLLILDRKTKIIERYEPFDQYLNLKQINDLIEPFLYKWMEQGKIYFFKYQTILNSGPVLNDRNCCIHCINYIMTKLKGT
jgi:hypothetical protein